MSLRGTRKQELFLEKVHHVKDTIHCLGEGSREEEQSHGEVAPEQMAASYRSLGPTLANTR